MGKRNSSREKQILIKGIVNGEPMHTEYGGDTSFNEVNFSINLTTEINATFKNSEPSILQSGTSIVVRCLQACYIRIGDQIELLGRLHKLALSNSIESYYIITRKLYNETLQFSFDY